MKFHEKEVEYVEKFRMILHGYKVDNPQHMIYAIVVELNLDMGTGR